MTRAETELNAGQPSNSQQLRQQLSAIHLDGYNSSQHWTGCRPFAGSSRGLDARAMQEPARPQSIVNQRPRQHQTGPIWPFSYQRSYFCSDAGIAPDAVTITHLHSDRDSSASGKEPLIVALFRCSLSQSAARRQCQLPVCLTPRYSRAASSLLRADMQVRITNRR